jgi:hypothetical protein
MSHTERALALRRIFSQMQLLSNDLEWLRLDSEIRGQFKQEIGTLIRRIDGFKQFAKMQTSTENWAHINSEMNSDRLHDFNLLFDLAIQFKDVNEITTALESLIKQQSAPQ